MDREAILMRIRKLAGERPWELRALQLALATNCVMLVVYLLFTMRLDFDSDTAAKNVVARLMLDQGRFFLRGFGYWNDLWILHGHVPLLVLIPLFGDNFLSNSLSSVVFAATFLPLVYLFVRRLDVRPEAALLTTLIVACGFSEEWASFMYGQAAYGAVALLLLLGLFASIEGLLASRRGANPLLLLFGVCALIGCYGPRFLITLVVPAAAGLVGLRLVRGGHHLTRGRIGLACAGLAAGLLFRAWVTSTIVFHAFGSHWLRPGEQPQEGFQQAVVRLFSLLPLEPVVTDDPWGLVFPLRLVFAIGLLASVGIASWWSRAASDARRFLVVFAWICAAMTVYSTLTIQVLAGKSRYLMPPFFALSLVAALAFDQFASARRGRRFLALATLPLLLLSFVTYVAPLIPRERGGVPWQRGYNRVRRLDQLIAALEDMGVPQAYMSYASSAAVTVLSSSRVKARQVQFLNGLPTPDPLLSLDRWYSEDSPRPTALVVDLTDPEQSSQFGLERLTSLLGPPLGVEERARFLIVRYSANVFPQLPEWQKQNLENGLQTRAVLGPRAVQSIPGVGKFEDGLLVSTGQPGPLVYGPYVRLPPGRYRIRVSLITRTDGRSPGQWDVSVDRPSLVLARGDLSAAPGEHDEEVERLIDISPALRDLRLEVRVFSSGVGQIRFRKTEIERVN